MKNIAFAAVLRFSNSNCLVFKKVFLFAFVTFMATGTFAQTAIQVKGKITDDKGAALSGASVTLKATKIGTITNIAL